MRLRNIPGADERIAASIYVPPEPEKQKGQWQNFFGNGNPIQIEIGMGKGRFLMTMAAANPQINYLGIERYSSVLIRALDKRESFEGNNLFFLCIDAFKVDEIFAQDEISRIYLNFSDPWPKDRHAKRRLTSTGFLKQYEKILRKNGEIEFKTDNTSLFDFSLEQLSLEGWETKYVNYHLHENGPAADNVMTEYEERFYEKGNRIHKLIAVTPHRL